MFISSLPLVSSGPQCVDGVAGHLSPSYSLSKLHNTSVFSNMMVCPASYTLFNQGSLREEMNSQSRSPGLQNRALVEKQKNFKLSYYYFFFFFKHQNSWSSFSKNSNRHLATDQIPSLPGLLSQVFVLLFESWLEKDICALFLTSSVSCIYQQTLSPPVPRPVSQWPFRQQRPRCASPRAPLTGTTPPRASPSPPEPRSSPGWKAPPRGACRPS